MWQRLKRIFARSPVEEWYDKPAGMPWDECVPREMTEAIGARLAAQVRVGHVALCPKCGKVLLEIEDSRTITLHESHIWMDSDSISVMAQCTCGGVFDVCDPAPREESS